MNERDPTVALRQIIEDVVCDEVRTVTPTDLTLARVWASKVAMEVLQRLADQSIEVVRR